MALEVEELSIRLGGRTVVDRVSFAVGDGERVGLIGESGSGKSLTALAVLGLLPEVAEVSGSVRWNGRELLALGDRELAGIRGREIGIVFQEPASALNPIRTVGAQIAATLRNHFDIDRREARRRAVDAAGRVRLPDPAEIVRHYPHQLSGGQRQRIAIAQAIIADPRLLIADEPTTALDVTIQAEILDLFERVVADTGSSLLFITHDLAVLSRIADRVVVFADGRIVEQATTRELVLNPQHDVSRHLIAAARQTSWRRPAGVIA
ncbi:ATP-binding cassette domain-containing protein [Microbacterium tumbae]